MRRTIVPIVLGLSLVAFSAATAATQLGVRGGWANATGDLFDGSGDPGSGGIYGFAASIGLFASIDVEFAYERYTSDFTFDAARFEDTLFSGEADYEDQAYLFTGRLTLPLLAAPFGLYGGGGFSLHDIDLKVDSSSDADLEDYIDQISGNRSEWEWHLVGGLGLKLPALPLRAYAEYRYQNVEGEDNPSYSSVYGGLNLYLK